MKRASLAVVFVVTALALRAHAYTLVIPQVGSVPRSWAPNNRTILFRINQDSGSALANVQPGSDVLAALNRALAVWPQAAAIQFTSQMSSVESIGGDGVNLITLKNTTANRMAIEMAGGPLGLTVVRSINDDIVEADIVFNPMVGFSTLFDSDGELQMEGWNDFEAVAAHELGHAIGLHHTGVEAATMWPLSSVLQRSLDSDDRAGARALYPSGGEGRIRGEITAGGQPVFGAHVVALRDGRVVASALTLPNGSYQINGLDAGIYTIYVEPLDGPHSSVPDNPCVRLGNLSGGGIYNNAVLSTDFHTTFFGGNTVPGQVEVAAGFETVVSFAAPTGIIPVNPVFVGPAMIDGGGISLRVGGGPLELIAGQRQAMAVAGAGLDTVTESGIGFIDPAITLEAGSLRTGLIGCNGNNIPFLLFEVNVSPAATTGARSIVFRRAGDISMMTGAVHISGVDPPTPTPTQVAATATATVMATATPTVPAIACVGDCDDGNTVTVDEIVTMVNIALGTQPVGSCLAGDADSSATVTVDEILSAISNALNGC